MKNEEKNMIKNFTWPIFRNKTTFFWPSFICTYDLNILEGIDIRFLKHQILIQISYYVNLIPHNCAPAEWLLWYRYSGILVTVSKGSV